MSADQPGSAGRNLPPPPVLPPHIAIVRPLAPSNIGYPPSGPGPGNGGSPRVPLPAHSGNYNQQLILPPQSQPLQLQVAHSQQGSASYAQVTPTSLQRDYTEPMDMEVYDMRSRSTPRAERAPQPNEQQLKVEDALNYLDQVKYKFGNQPQVYNQFLDIMKEFKSSRIDTPGVISRVSDLFHGHPELIVGFNAFLPSGYKIEMQMLGQGHGPHGQGYVVRTVQTGPEAQNQPPMLIPSATALPPSQPQQHTVIVPHQPNIHSSPARSVLGQSNVDLTVTPITPSRVSTPPQLQTVNYDTNPPSFTHSCSSPFVQSAFPSMHSQPVEFSQAINYVSKIKERFHEEPEKYKQFLDILHAYQNQKMQRTPEFAKLTEQEVCQQVSKLFRGQEDLLEEFTQFLPDATNNQHPAMKIAIDQAKKEVQPVYPPAITMPAKRPSIQPGHHAKQSKMTAPHFPEGPNIPLAEAEKYGTLRDFALFDKIRQALNCSTAYTNFLRCLTLYNSEIISRTELINIVQPFFAGNLRIFNIFKNFLAEDNRDEFEPAGRPNIPGLGRADKLSEDKIMEVDFSSCRRLGASYCALPNSHVQPLCSGRSEREKEVLNDVWVSFPTWSEDSTFVNSRKTTYEEYIYRCEEERYELDAVIETNLATIQTLNRVNHRMASMSTEDLKNFKLDDSLGGSSQTIYQRAIRRLYGDKATDMIEMMKANPSVSVPLVLKRLRDKHAAWTEAQKGFNKVWREQMEKFYLKSLDHQGITFKQTDIRMLRPKALVNEIESLMEERQEQESLNGESFVVSGIPHLSLQYSDRGIMTDACNLLLHHVRRQSGIQNDDKKKIKRIVKHFMFDIFHLEHLDLSDDDAPDSPDDGGSPSGSSGHATNTGNKSGTKKQPESAKKKTAPKAKSDHNSTESSSSGSDSSSDNAGKRKQHTKAASRRGKMKAKPFRFFDRTASTKSSKSNKGRKLSFRMKDISGKVESAIFALPDHELIAQYNEYKEHELKQERAAQEIRNGNVMEPEIVAGDEEAYSLFYANRSWYVFMRLHHILCERLNRILETARSIINEEVEEGKPSIPGPAIQLKLQDPREIEPEEYYSNFLDMVRNLLDGNLELANYEDTLRERFGIHAYIAYTLDKVVVNAVRQLQSLVTDEKSVKCFDLYHKFSKTGGTGGSISGTSSRVEEEVKYRKSAEKHCDTDGCTRVVICKNRCRMNMELLSSDTLESATKHEQDTKMYFLLRIIDNCSLEARKAKEILGLTPFLLERNVKVGEDMERKKKRKDEYQYQYKAMKYHLTPPKYYRPKASEGDPVEPEPKGELDVDLDLLQHPAKYEYLYSKDIRLNLSVTLPPGYIIIPPVVRLALVKQPGVSPKRERQRAVAKVRQTRFDQWHQRWCKQRTSDKSRKSIDSWFLGGDSGNESESIAVEAQSVNPPEAPFRTVRKFVSNKQLEVYAFPPKTSN